MANKDKKTVKKEGISETTENYLKRIYWLIKSKGYARVTEISQLMGRSLSSTTEAIQRMAKIGLLNYEKYGKITLTEEGMKIAEQIDITYEVMSELLVLLGVPKNIAINDACSMEHQISETTINAIKEFVEFAKKDEKCSEILKTFREEKIRKMLKKR